MTRTPPASTFRRCAPTSTRCTAPADNHGRGPGQPRGGDLESTRTPTRGPTLRTGAARHCGGMSINMYVINAILVLLVVRQIREHQLDLRALAVPVLAVGAATVMFLHSVPGGGSDIALDLLCLSAGAALGAAGGLATHLRVGADPHVRRDRKS